MPRYSDAEIQRATERYKPETAEKAAELEPKSKSWSFSFFVFGMTCLRCRTRSSARNAITMP